jgi:hypothetical protein
LLVILGRVAGTLRELAGFSPFGPTGSEAARTVLVAAEHAVANDDVKWVISHREQIESAATEVVGTHDEVAVRLRLTIADATGDWADLIRAREDRDATRP